MAINLDWYHRQDSDEPTNYEKSGSGCVLAGERAPAWEQRARAAEFGMDRMATGYERLLADIAAEPAACTAQTRARRSRDRARLRLFVDRAGHRRTAPVRCVDAVLAERCRRR